MATSEVNLIIATKYSKAVDLCLLLFSCRQKEIYRVE